MSEVQRSMDVVEERSGRALASIIGGVVALAIGAAFFTYGAKPLGSVLGVIGLGLLGYGIYESIKARQVGGVTLECPYCKGKNLLTAQPTHDFACRNCNRMVPVENGVMLEVNQVRCGYCNALNFWSARSFGLICEECDREIPIAGLEGGRKRIEQFAVRDDQGTYELVLVSFERMSEDLITCLQHMLALNRNQVKDILVNLPQPLLQGIPRKKAELLTAQLGMHGAKAEFREIQPA